MRVRFWGTRGSLAVPGPDTVRYGGNTSCVEVESDAGTLIVIDCGTGAQPLGRSLLSERPSPRRASILISHTHWDHIQGFPFFAPLFAPGDQWDVYGPRGLGTSLRDTLAGQMQYTYFPVTLDAMGAEIRYHSLLEGSFQVGDVTVRTRYLNHPVLTLAYRLEVDGAVFVYACDHEPHDRAAASGDLALEGHDKVHAEFIAGADLLVHDAQFTAHEYPSKVGWGHSTVEYALRVAREAGVRRLVVTHHDPARTDVALDALGSKLSDAGARGEPTVEVTMAAEGSTLEIRGRRRPSSDGVEGARQPSALREEASVEGRRVVLAMPPGADADLIEEAMEADGLDLERTPNSDAFERALEAEAPSLVVVPCTRDGIAFAEAVRRRREPWADEIPIVAAGPERVTASCLTDVLVAPFSVEFVRARVRAWLLRTPARWVRAPKPDDDRQRVHALHRLGILDTEASERFDRITRLAAALLGTHVSLVSLVDEDRQWFKSVEGWDQRETSRDASFCSHAILDDAPFVVADAAADERFADNPLVAGPPYVRFYAGCPLTLPDGHRVGTLCVLDPQARQLSATEIALLRDLADLAEEELARYAER